MSTSLNIGILAHVDAGKTTLSEALLYEAGAVRSIGRVDHGDAFLDTFDLEKERGITIFSKQARLEAFDRKITLMDTPGHIDFSPETERTLQVLDAAILVISAADGVGAHVRTLWSLLEHYNVPTFIFVNKMDQPGSDMDEISALLSQSLGSSVVNMTPGVNDPMVCESIAVCDDNLLGSYLNGTPIKESDIINLISKRLLFPCYYGSALKGEGVKAFLENLCRYAPTPSYPDDFGARVYKISRDSDGTRLSFLKITGGSISVRDTFGEEKISQIRLYSGSKYEQVQSAEAGTICAIAGLSGTRAGDGLGFEASNHEELLEPILNCRILLPDDEDPYKVWQNLLILQEEEPMLSVSRTEENGDIYVRVMGQVQMEIIKRLMMDRFKMSIDFGQGRIIYKETIANTVEGVGHFEPLRHYAEVHLMLEPSAPGSGLSFEANCPTDILARNWQRLVLTHLEEKKHKGVLTGSEITDMKITLISGKAHLKHTEGGDFRKATYRAVRQGLMMANSVLLEPVYRYELIVPSENVGRAMTDLSQRNATVNSPEIENGKTVLRGTIPAACLGNYAEDVRSYTSGEGSISCVLKGYAPCHNAEEVIADSHYDPELDTHNPCSSVFCSHGVGTVIPWNDVRKYMHVDTGWRPEGDNTPIPSDIAMEYDLENITAFKARTSNEAVVDNRSFSEKERDYRAGQDELMAIFEKTYGPIKDRRTNNDDDRPRTYGVPDDRPKGISDPKYDEKRDAKAQKKANGQKEYLLIDGYNVLFASSDLKSLAERDINAARDKLMDIVSNFQGYRRENIILVFDAYKVHGGSEKVLKYHNLDVIYTKEAETADQYIERTSHELSKNYKVTVATSDGIEQVIILGAGGIRMPAKEFWDEVKNTEDQIRQQHIETLDNKLHNYVLKDIDLNSTDSKM
ncbi:translation factor GTPase family protein [Butyrivibrio fibrisolvens]|uniref:translation factor GTPase family protein n=1 Tax=Butyrivibrio fibrisolvens TaxID=831 RepID=UPI00041748DF|nr:TetM/TetW/TetO/TetS family tetracycline resistance ribosomal protection protein [Butyrivibrio fibrisolvens]